MIYAATPADEYNVVFEQLTEEKSHDLGLFFLNLQKISERKLRLKEFLV
jgi:hypothetical protein